MGMSAQAVAFITHTVVQSIPFQRRNMKLYEPTFLICMVLLISALVIGLASNKLAHMGEDNIVEELAEEVIESQSGLDVDLSPESPEVKK